MVDIIQHRMSKTIYSIPAGQKLPSGDWVRVLQGLSVVEAEIYLNNNKPPIVNPKRKC